MGSRREHPARPRSAGAAGPADPGPPRAPDRRGAAGARREAAGHARARPQPARQPGHRRAGLRGAGGGRAGAGPRGAGHVRRRAESGARRGAPAPLQPAPIDWTALLSRSARIVAADEERRRALGTGDGVTGTAISFAGGMPDSALFPTDAFRRVLNQRGARRGRGAPAVLRRWAATRRCGATWPATCCASASRRAPRRSSIVNGSQQGFDLIARTLVDPGDLVAIEQPTYPGAMQVVPLVRRARSLPVEWDASGPRPDVFERLCERQAPKLFYCQPSAHNPTGLTLEPEVGRRLLAAAARHQVPIVEDGFDGSLYYGARPRHAAEGRRPRRGRDLHRHLLEDPVPGAAARLAGGAARAWSSGCTPPSSSPTCTRARCCRRRCTASASGGCSTVTSRASTAEYARRRTLLLTALRRRMPEGVTWTEPMGGFSLLLTLPAGLTAGALLPAAIERGVAFTPGPAFFLDGGGRADAAPGLLVGGGARASTRACGGWRRRSRRARRQPRPQRTEYQLAPVL